MRCANARRHPWKEKAVQGAPDALIGLGAVFTLFFVTLGPLNRSRSRWSSCPAGCASSGSFRVESPGSSMRNDWKRSFPFEGN